MFCVLFIFIQKLTESSNSSSLLFSFCFPSLENVTEKECNTLKIAKNCQFACAFSAVLKLKKGVIKAVLFGPNWRRKDRGFSENLLNLKLMFFYKDFSFSGVISIKLHSSCKKGIYNWNYLEIAAFKINGYIK